MIASIFFMHGPPVRRREGATRVPREPRPTALRKSAPVQAGPAVPRPGVTVACLAGDQGAHGTGRPRAGRARAGCLVSWPVAGRSLGRDATSADAARGTPPARQEGAIMADFAHVITDAGRSLWINLDYVTRITPGLDPREPTTVRFAEGRALVLPPAESAKLLQQLNLCCVKRKEQ